MSALSSPIFSCSHFFPLLIFISLLLASLHVDASIVTDYLNGVVPKLIVDTITNYLQYLTTLESKSLMFTGLAMSVYFASRAVNCLFSSINHAHRSTRSRNYIAQFILSIVFTVVMLVSLVITLGAFGLRPQPSDVF